MIKFHPGCQLIIWLEPSMPWSGKGLAEVVADYQDDVQDLNSLTRPTPLVHIPDSLRGAGLDASPLRHFVANSYAKDVRPDLVCRDQDDREPHAHWLEQAAEVRHAPGSEHCLPCAVSCSGGVLR